MGCSPSITPSPKGTDSKPDLFLTERQIQLIKCSWDLIQDVMLETGMEIYAYFLETLEGDLLKLFSKVIITEENGNALDVDKDMLQRHAMLVMRGIETAVCLLEDKPGLDAFLETIGHKHYKTKVKPYMLERLWPAIDYSFRGVLLDVYESEVRNSWKTFFDYMVLQMSESMHNIKRRRLEEKEKSRSERMTASRNERISRTDANKYVPSTL